MAQINDQGKVTRKVAQDIEESTGEDKNLVTLSSGVVLEVFQANPHTLIKVMTRTRRPEPPTYYAEKLGKEVENPDDPDYIARVKSWEMDYNSAMLNALIGLGTKLHSKPKGMPGPEDESWLKDYSVFLTPHPESKMWRYIEWVLFVAATSEKDTLMIGAKVRELSGVKEADVRDAVSFPEGDEKSR